MKMIILLIGTFAFCTLSFQSISQEEKLDHVSSASQTTNIAERASLECITPPEKFDTLSDFNGYFHKQNGASILLLKVEGKSVEDAEKSLSDEYFESINSKLITKSRMKINSGDELVIYKLAFEYQQIPFIRYHAFTGDDQGVLWVISSYRRMDEDAVENDILNSFKTLNLEKR